MKRYKLFVFFVTALITISLGILGGCKPQKKSETTGTAAKAAQQITTPTLAPPPSGEAKPREPGVPPAAGTEATPPGGKASLPGALTLSPPVPAEPAPPPAAAMPVEPEKSQPPAVTPPALPPVALPAEPALPATPPAAQPPSAMPAAPALPATPPPPAQSAPQLGALPAPPVGTPPATSTPSIAQPVPFVPSLVNAQTNVNILLDASGSQSAPFGGKEVKFDLQKTALSDVILQLKQTDFPRNIGIRVFGAGRPLAQHDCTDTQQIYPIGTPNLDAIQNLVTPLSAMGESPIAGALEAASKDFPAQANIDQVIVLITDGTDTCGVDPCQTARAIHTANPKMIINVIGFDVSQEDLEKIQCIATNSEGKFYLARNENELRRSLDEAVGSTIPYNLRLTTVAGATPIPTTISILKAGTDQVLKTETSFGSKSLRLAPGAYDILVEYTGSPELKKPSKIIKGVEILEKTKVEQEINFDLGSVTVSTIDSNGKLSGATYQITRSGTNEQAARLETGSEAATFFLTPGTYDIMAEQKGALPEKIALTESNVELKTGESVEKTFRFQKGMLGLKGLTTQNVNIPFLFQIYKGDKPDQLVASGAFGADGGTVTLSPGSYDITFIGQDPAMMANPRTKATGVTVIAAETNDITASFEMGALKLSAVDGQGNPVQAEFTVRLQSTQEEMGKFQMTDAATPVSVSIPPGTYDVIAASTKQVIEPKPTVLISGVEISAAAPAERVAKFVFGTMRLRGRSAKEQPLETKFTLYKSGTDEIAAGAPPSSDWLTFQIAPGRYDAEAFNLSAEGEVKPTVRMQDLLVEDGKQASYEAIFTAGKLKVIGRGPNNKIISCHFKVYQYGADTELVNGDTGDDWQTFDIQPGSYYLEAGYVDPIQSVLLKKWINVKVGENEVVELILRF